MTTGGSSLHIVEPGGRGGVFQHVLGAIQNGQFKDYEQVILHTAKDAEVQPLMLGLSFCNCMRYQRKGTRPLRAAISLAWVAGRMLPHLFLTAARKTGDWEIQGLFGKGIYAALVGIPRMFGRDVTFVPHNSFSRSGNKLEALTLNSATKRANRTVAFVRSELDKFPSSNSVVLRRLWQYVTPIDEEKAHEWSGWLRESGKPVVLFLGQLRRDKNPLLLLEAVNAIEAPLTVVFAGEDKGAVGEIESFPLAPQHKRIVIKKYLDIADFQAVIHASDVLACPYTVASQSGVISLAVQMGKPVIASNVGGLAEQTPHTFDAYGNDPANALSGAILTTLAAL